MLQCIPLEKSWVPVGDRAIKSGHCFPTSVVESIIIVQGVFSIMTDFIGAGFPVILLWNAKLNMRVKIALNLLMGLGVITGTVCIVRTSYSWEILSNDVTWVGIGNALTRMYAWLSLPTLVHFAEYVPQIRSQSWHHWRLRARNASPIPSSPLALPTSPRLPRQRPTHARLPITLVHASFVNSLVQVHLPHPGSRRRGRRPTF